MQRSWIIRFLTGNSSIELAARAIKLGAEQFLTKPADPSTLRLMLDRAIENEPSWQRQPVDRAREKQHGMDPFLGTNLPVHHGAHWRPRLFRAGTRY
jgi:FixJ family two-component response regulator